MLGRQTPPQGGRRRDSSDAASSEELRGVAFLLRLRKCARHARPQQRLTACRSIPRQPAAVYGIVRRRAAHQRIHPHKRGSPIARQGSGQTPSAFLGRVCTIPQLAVNESVFLLHFFFNFYFLLVIYFIATHAEIIIMIIT